MGRPFLVRTDDVSSAAESLSKWELTIDSPERFACSVLLRFGAPPPDVTCYIHGMSAKKSFGIFWKVAAVAVLALIAAVAWLVASFDEQVRPVIAINYAEELASLAREYQPESGTQPNRRDEFIDLVLETQRVKERAIGDSRLRITRAIDSPPEEEPEPAASPFGDGDPTFAEDREVAMDYLAALERFKTLPRETLVLPSHGVPFHGLHARIDVLLAGHAAHDRRRVGTAAGVILQVV